MLDEMVLEPAEDLCIQQSPTTPTYSAHTAFSYDAAAVPQSAPTRRLETNMR